MQKNIQSAQDKLIVALDLPSLKEAEAMIERLGSSVSFYKIGYELAFIGGIDLAQRLIKSGKKVFLDLKLHDIGNTIERATAQIAGMGATYMTIHAYPQTMAAAVKGKQGSDLQILAVSILTSMDDHDAVEAGYAHSVAQLVAQRAQKASDLGVDGLICSAADLAGIRQGAGAKLKLVTPGIRPAGAALGDQKRVMTPVEALRAGADGLVIGRPITSATDPRAAAEAILAEMSQV